MNFSFQTNKPKSYQYECIDQKNEGAIVLKIWNPAKSKKYKFQDAQKDGIRVVLYSGITANANCQVTPPMLRNSEELDKFQKIESVFFSKEGNWNRFSNQNLVEKTEMINNCKTKVYEVSISKNLLRKYLEEQKIISSLTTGF